MISVFKSLLHWRTTQKQVLICGPSNAGKTSLLATLQLAAEQGTAGSWPSRVRTFPATAGNAIDPNRASVGVDDDTAGNNMRVRWREARETVSVGRFPIGASNQIMNYAFDLELDHFDLWTAALYGRQRTMRFRLIDGPGGSLLPKDREPTTQDKLFQTEYRNQLVEYARSSQALVICVDGTDESLSGSFFRELSPLLLEVRRDQRYLQLESIVIVLTKADVAFAGRGKEAMQAAIDAEPWDRAADLLTNAGMSNLLDLTDPLRTELCCAWTSPYGFCSDGSPNFDSVRGQMKHFVSGKGWQPFQLLDPFIYLSAGEMGGLRALDR